MNASEVAKAKADLAAYVRARAEAEAWSAVRDHLALTASVACRDVLGMSIRETARALGLSRSALACTLWKGSGDHAPVSAEAEELMWCHLEEVWTTGDREWTAPPEGHRNADAECVPLAERIRDVVRRHPGIAGTELSRMLAAAFGSRPSDLRGCAEDAGCMVDGGNRWWPTKPVGELRAGDQIPRHLDRFERTHEYEWVTIDSLAPDEIFGDFVDVHFASAESDEDGSAWSGVPHYEVHPIRSWE